MVSLNDKGNFQSTPRDPIIEAAARALEALDDDSAGLENCADWFQDSLRQQATAVLAAVSPLIRAAALEEAAQTVETMLGRRDAYARDNIAAAIRDLKEQP
jgi:hypothetical protein